MFEDVDEGHLDQDDSLHFYYSREHRLLSAPQSVRDFYDGKMKPVRGFKVLFTNKANRSILFALVFFVGAAWIYSGFNNLRYSGKIGSVSAELQAFSFEEEIYVSLKLTDKKSAYSQGSDVKADIFFIDADNQTVSKDSLDFVYTGEEQFLRTKATDYDIMRVDAVVSVGQEKKELSVKVKH